MVFRVPESPALHACSLTSAQWSCENLSLASCGTGWPKASSVPSGPIPESVPLPIYQKSGVVLLYANMCKRCYRIFNKVSYNTCLETV